MTSQLTREQATDSELQMLIDSHEKGTAMFLRVDAYYLMAKELQERRKVERDSEPVAWTDEEELRDVDRGGCGYLFTVNPVTPHADERRIILLYRHVQQPIEQPVPVVPDGYVMVPKVVTPEIGNAINEVGHRCTCGNCSQRLWDLLLAAAPQEVRNE